LRRDKKRNPYKENTMKSILKFVAILGLLLAASTIPAAAQGKRMLVLKAPFGFTVENHTVPAGTYWITLQDRWLQIQTADGEAVASVLTLPASQTKEGNARVVFHQYHERYFLSEVWLASSQRGRQTLESREEQRSRKLESPQAVTVQLTTPKEGR
jgi:hypothetical protein